jgi:hypothetical protein
MIVSNKREYDQKIYEFHMIPLKQLISYEKIMLSIRY